MLSVVVDTAEQRSMELHSREDFHWLIGPLDARWFGVGLRSIGERALSDPLLREAYRFSWFSPDRSLRVGRLNHYPIGIFGLSKLADGWPTKLRRESTPERLDQGILNSIRARVDSSWGAPRRPAGNHRWLLESWRDGFYRAEVGHGGKLEDLPQAGLSLLLLNDLIL